MTDTTRGCVDPQCPKGDQPPGPFRRGMCNCCYHRWNQRRLRNGVQVPEGQPRNRWTTAELVEDIGILRGRGLDVDQVAARLRVSAKRVKLAMWEVAA